MRKILSGIVILLTAFSLNATNGVVYHKSDSVTFEKYITENKKHWTIPINELIVKTSLWLADKPYVAHTLEKNEDEQLVVNLNELDCTTLIETCIALSKTLKSGETGFPNYCTALKKIRYRNGEIKNYASRLHYMTDWMYDNSKKGLVTDITKKLGGVVEPKTIDFMSTHPDKYEPLKNSPELQKQMAEIEKQITKRKKFYYLKKEDIDKSANKIEDGDIVIFATNIKGIDYSHVGIAYHNNGYLGFIHASSKAMKVMIEPQSLKEYCDKQKSCTGITVLRLK